MQKINQGFMVVLLLASAACRQAPSRQGTSIPVNMHYVTPVTGSSTNPAGRPVNNTAEPAALQIGRGQFFSYALPPGWRVGEDGQFALSLVAPDNQAYTVMVGNAGLMPDYPPASFVYEKMMAMRPHNLRMGEPRQATAVHGFQYAYAFDISYELNGSSYQGEAVCHVAPYYGGSTMAMTAAIAAGNQWNSYASWLPAVSKQIAATNGAAFGMRGMMQQNLQNSMAFAAAAKSYREWSVQKQQELTDYRNAVTDKQQEQFRDNLGAVQRYNNPYSNGTEVQLTTQYQYYWMNRDGSIVGTNDPGENPNTGSTGDWQKMEQKKY